MTTGGSTVDQSCQDVTFVACIEHGVLEDGVLRLVESLRRHGGKYAGSRFIAVKPRLGPPLRAYTRRRLRELSCELVEIHPRNAYAWHSYLNKYYALAEAESRTPDALIAFMDSDTLFMSEPDEFDLAPDVDVAACPRDRNIGLSNDPHDANLEFWTRACRLLDLTVEQLPWVKTEIGAEDIRLYWNAGVFVYRKESGFLQAWFDAQRRLLGAAGPDRHLIFWNDQVALGLAAVRAGLRVGHLSGAMNYGLATYFNDHVTTPGLAGAKVLHHHDSMTVQHWGWFMVHLSQARPDVVEWLEPLGPVDASSNLPRRAFRLVIKGGRRLRRWSWERRQASTTRPV